MWPFKSKSESKKLSYGFHSGRFDLTAEELRQVDMLFDGFKGFAIKEEVVEKFQNMLIARGIANYADDQRAYYESTNDAEYLNKASASYIKAYSVHQLPIYCFDIATCFETLGKIEAAKEMFLMFITKQSEFATDDFDKICLAGRDIDELKHYAVSRI